jgi:hypothetical protein
VPEKKLLFCYVEKVACAYPTFLFALRPLPPTDNFDFTREGGRFDARRIAHVAITASNISTGCTSN